MSLFGKKKRKEPVVLIEQDSPVCDIHAVLEETETCIYLYTYYGYGQENKENAYVNSCWLCNLQNAPEALDQKAMENGEAPMMPAEFCKTPNEPPAINPKELSFIWFEEGNGVALLDGDRLLAVVPPWACEDMPGYSAFALGTGPFAWTLDDAYDTLKARIDKAESFWAYTETDYWADLQQTYLSVLEDFLETKDYKYYAIDGGYFPPKALVSAEKDGIAYGITLGVSLVPQPNVEQWHQEQSSDFCRIELGFACDAALPPDQTMDMLGHISGDANMPWRTLSWLGHEHTVSCRAFEGFPAVTMINTSLFPGLRVPRYDSFRGDRVNLLWLVPITAEEYETAMTKEQPVDVLLGLYKGDLNNLLVFDGKPKFITK